MVEMKYGVGLEDIVVVEGKWLWAEHRALVVGKWTEIQCNWKSILLVLLENINVIKWNLYSNC